MITLVLLMFRMFLQSSACTVIYKTTALPGCEKDFTPSTVPLNSSTVTYGTECLLLCRNNNKCNGISICPDPGNSSFLSCDLFATATDGTCGNLTSAAGCRYLEFEAVPNGPQCVPPRIFDEERDECVCDPVWMSGPNCDQYYIDCSHAYTDGLFSTASDDILVMQIKPRMSGAPFQTKCYLNYGGSIIVQRRHLSCPDEYTGRSWDDFRDGFGDINCSFFLGLAKMWEVLQNGIFHFKVQVYSFDGFNGHAYYYKFNMADESTNYTIDWDRFKTQSPFEAEDGLEYGGPTKKVKGSRFATHDRDFNGCAQAQGTGWWYNEDCALVNLHLPLNTPPPSGATWPRNGALRTFEEMAMLLKRIG